MLRDGVAVGFPPGAFDLLVTMVDGVGRLVPKHELLERVWPEVIVIDNALQRQMSALSLAPGARFGKGSRGGRVGWHDPKREASAAC